MKELKSEFTVRVNTMNDEGVDSRELDFRYKEFDTTVEISDDYVIFQVANGVNDNVLYIKIEKDLKLHLWDLNSSDTTKMHSLRELAKLDDLARSVSILGEFLQK